MSLTIGISLVVLYFVFTVLSILASLSTPFTSDKIIGITASFLPLINVVGSYCFIRQLTTHKCIIHNYIDITKPRPNQLIRPVSYEIYECTECKHRFIEKYCYL